ncbi:unnamed protein product [Eruca vesicaria subsp. sativa]|uniref:SHSP domain-containing protein n=1 Tax=Eruca vesicaria subsp. sativa TaxID=29727 RepID=A0ABC8JWB3_ERUVS|nr:unnamed protein product [Eruca vesicaria subsp. sativa]
MVLTLPATQVPQSSADPVNLFYCFQNVDGGAEGFYTVHNPFQISGPKGYREVKILENGDMYVRTDLPGCDFVDVRIDSLKKSVTSRTLVASPFDPIVNPYESFTPRSYSTTDRLMCDCCRISLVKYHKITDGVLRVVISTTPTSDPQNRAGHAILNNTDPNDPRLTGLIPSTGNPHLIQGHGSGAYEFKSVTDGTAYVRLDMPGVPKHLFNAKVNYGELKPCKRSRRESTVVVTGTAPAVDQDSGDRVYSAIAAIVYDSTGAILLESDPENGVMRLTIRAS